VSWQDDINISHWTISENQTGTWVNETASDVWLKDDSWYKAAGSLYITAAKNTNFRIMMFANDTSDNINNTLRLDISVLNAVPDTEDILVNSTSSENFEGEDVYCYARIYDPDSGDTLVVNYSWYKNGVNVNLTGNITVSNNETSLVAVLKGGNTTGGDEWRCLCKAYDGHDAEPEWNNKSIYIARKPYCGDGICNNDETCSSCAQDCGACETTASGTMCNHRWECTGWECHPDNISRRDCINKGSCPDHWKAPETEKACNYKARCDDGILNGDEQGIDCGGSCRSCIEVNVTQMSPIEGYVSLSPKDYKILTISIIILAVLILAFIAILIKKEEWD
jgi:hypothetical protein